jgi:uncharacterized protein YjbJ (UPF0337 family)
MCFCARVAPGEIKASAASKSVSEKSHDLFRRSRRLAGFWVSTLERSGKQGHSASLHYRFTSRRPAMHEDIIGGKWRQLKGKLKEQWGELTDDDVAVIEGRREILAGKLQERYGLSKEEADDCLKT